ncbi:MAG TPA: methylenetetrahydrofolate reductase [NAD(P)H] [Planctomycetota bacterium]|nr:methylenetetrahydrofolate reductase [NAD(P)H] [Planctomycetota bacterium]
MKWIRDIHAECKSSNRPVISFEFFPPKTDEGDKTLLEKTLPALAALKPDYCSVTYGAGGSTREKTLMIVDRIQKQIGLTAMSHLTCVNATREQIGQVLDQAKALGIKNILALRGDPPGGVGEFKKTEGGFEFSKELVGFIREKGDFSIGTAGFPEGHIACKDKYTDWQHLKNKIEAGADFVLTQLFFDNNDFFEFYDHLRNKLNVKVPICPGILPIQTTSGIKRFSSLCGARLPSDLVARLESFGDDDDACAAFGVEFATKQCEALLKAGVPGLHFYTLNKARSTSQIMKNLKLA